MIRSPTRPKPSRLVATTTTSGQLLAQRISQRRRRVEHMLTVVEHQQQLPSGQGVGNRGDPPTVTGFDTQNAANEWTDRVRRRQRCELTEPHTIAETRLRLRGELECQPGLSRAANPVSVTTSRRFNRLTDMLAARPRDRRTP